MPCYLILIIFKLADILPFRLGLDENEKYIFKIIFIIKFNYIDLLRKLMKDCNVDFNYVAVSFGHLEILKYLHENGCSWNVRSCEIASMKGHLECLKYLHENGCPWNERCCENASYNGHLEVLKYLHENGCPQ